MTKKKRKRAKRKQKDREWFDDEALVLGQIAMPYESFEESDCYLEPSNMNEAEFLESMRNMFQVALEKSMMFQITVNPTIRVIGVEKPKPGPKKKTKKLKLVK